MGGTSGPTPEAVQGALAYLATLRRHPERYVVASAHRVAATIEAGDWHEVAVHLLSRPWLRRRLAVLYSQVSPYA